MSFSQVGSGIKPKAARWFSQCRNPSRAMRRDEWQLHLLAQTSSALHWCCTPVRFHHQHLSKPGALAVCPTPGLSSKASIHSEISVLASRTLSSATVNSILSDSLPRHSSPPNSANRSPALASRRAHSSSPAISAQWLTRVWTFSSCQNSFRNAERTITCLKLSASVSPIRASRMGRKSPSPHYSESHVSCSAKTFSPQQSSFPALR
jgi:hypothetical protein